MDPALRDFARDLDRGRVDAPVERHRKAVVVTYQAGPPRTATINIAGSTVNVPTVPLLASCPGPLAPGDVVWVRVFGTALQIVGPQA